MKRFSTICFVILLLLFAVESYGQDPLYEEHFTNGVTDLEWQSVYGMNSDNVVEAVFVDIDPPPTNDLWVGKLATPAEGDFLVSGAGDTNLADYRIEAWAYLVVSSGTTVVNNGIVARAHYEESTGLFSYIFCSDFDQNNGNDAPRLRLLAYSGAMFPATIMFWGDDQIPGGAPAESGWHKLALEVEGNQISCWYDEQLMPGCPYTDDTISEGGLFGVYTLDMVSLASTYVEDIIVTLPDTPVEPEQNELLTPERLLLSQNFPNPFNPHTTIEYKIADWDNVSLTIYDIQGRLVKRLIEQPQAAGNYTIEWNGINEKGLFVDSGIYIYRLQTATAIQTKQMILLK